MCQFLVFNHGQLSGQAIEHLSAAEYSPSPRGKSYDMKSAYWDNFLQP